MIGKPRIPTRIQKSVLEDLEAFGWIKLVNRKKVELDTNISFSFVEEDEDERDVEVL